MEEQYIFPPPLPVSPPIRPSYTSPLFFPLFLLFLFFCFISLSSFSATTLTPSVLPLPILSFPIFFVYTSIYVYLCICICSCISIYLFRFVSLVLSFLSLHHYRSVYLPYFCQPFFFFSFLYPPFLYHFSNPNHSYIFNHASTTSFFFYPIFLRLPPLLPILSSHS